MTIWRRRGTVLVVALFAVIVVHALVTGVLLGLRTDTGLLKHSQQQLNAELRARSAVEYALAQLNSSTGLAWEQAHTVTSPISTRPPQSADTLQVPGPDGSSIRCRAWVELTANPEIRNVWGATLNGNTWEFSTASTVRRPVNPGMLYGGVNTSTGDQVYFLQHSNSDGWVSAPPLPFADSVIFHGAADHQGSLFLTIRDRAQPPNGRSLQVVRLDTQAGTNGTWTVLTPPPSNFRVDPTGVAVGGGSVYLVGRPSVNAPPEILALPIAQTGTTPPTWTSLGQLPRPGTISTNAFNVSSITADSSGSLFLNLFQETNGISSSTFARYKNGAWAFIDNPPQLQGVGPSGYLPLELDDLGNPVTYALPNGPDRPGEIYRFAAGAGGTGNQLPGTWKRLEGATSAVQAGQSRGFRNLSIDTEGRAYVGLKTQPGLQYGFSQLRQYQLRSAETTATSVTPPTGNLNFTEAGGEGETGEFQYVAVSWH